MKTLSVKIEVNPYDLEEIFAETSAGAYFTHDQFIAFFTHLIETGLIHDDMSFVDISNIVQFTTCYDNYKDIFDDYHFDDEEELDKQGYKIVPLTTEREEQNCWVVYPKNL